MHDIEPHYQWRDHYIASKDDKSPFFGKINDEFKFHNKIYNYLIHPQWDEFGSPTLYMKILFVDYGERFAIIELIGEWNDCLHNDIMSLKRNVIDQLIGNDIIHFILICDNVLNFHNSDNCYYEEWYEDICDEGGWICMLNTMDHIEQEMKEVQIQYYANFGHPFNDVRWRPHKPKLLFSIMNTLLDKRVKEIG